MSFISCMKDKRHEKRVQNVLHQVNEGQKSKKRVRNVLHRVYEGQNTKKEIGKSPSLKIIRILAEDFFVVF